MGYGLPDWYNQPEAFGLDFVASAELSEPCWSFDTAVVWYHKALGGYVLGTDSGCSCPSPFEGFINPVTANDTYTSSSIIFKINDLSSYDSSYLAEAKKRLIEQVKAFEKSK